MRCWDEFECLVEDIFERKGKVVLVKIEIVCVL